MQAFSLGEAAFAGTTVFDISFLDLPAADSNGDIFIVDNFGRPVPESFVGEYRYTAPIPEPAGLLALGAVGALLLRRR